MRAQQCRQRPLSPAKQRAVASSGVANIPMQFNEGSIVRPPGGPCMSVISYHGDGRVTCGWLEEEEVRIAHLPADVLEEVSAINEEEAWLQAFRDRGVVLEYLRKRNRAL